MSGPFLFISARRRSITEPEPVRKLGYWQGTRIAAQLPHHRLAFRSTLRPQWQSQYLWGFSCYPRSWLLLNLMYLRPITVDFQ